MIAENADGRALLEFVADVLLVRPFRPKLINENLELILRDSFLGIHKDSFLPLIYSPVSGVSSQLFRNCSQRNEPFGQLHGPLCILSRDDGVALGYRELRRVWGESDAFHDVPGLPTAFCVVLLALDVFPKKAQVAFYRLS